MKRGWQDPEYHETRETLWEAGGTRTGTSMAAAQTAGAAALLMEWGLLKGNDLQLNSHKIIKYLTLGAVRREGVVYPDRAWGYGRLNLLKTFNELVTGRT